MPWKRSTHDSKPRRLNRPNWRKVRKMVPIFITIRNGKSIHTFKKVKTKEWEKA